MEVCDLELIGHHHSGIDDCHNLARIVKFLAGHLVFMQITSNVAPKSKKKRQRNKLKSPIPISGDGVGVDLSLMTYPYLRPFGPAAYIGGSNTTTGWDSQSPSPHKTGNWYFKTPLIGTDRDRLIKTNHSLMIWLFFFGYIENTPDK